MVQRAVLKMGHPTLRQMAARVTEFGTPELAAPQIGVGLRVVIFEVRENPRYPGIAPIPYTVLINPVITPLREQREEGWEGCLSVPGMRGLVPRFRQVRYQGFDADGVPIDRTVEGFHARVVQHEVDHLDGILYPERILDLRNFGFEEALLGQMTPMPD